MNTKEETATLLGIGMIEVSYLIAKGDLDAVRIAPGPDGIRVPDKSVQEMADRMAAANN